MSEPGVHAVLLVSCPDRAGLVARLADFVFRHGGNILSADQHSDPDTGQFFMRLVWDLDGFALDRTETARRIGALASELELRWQLAFSDVRQRVVVFTSRAAHCLYDLLLTARLGELGGDVAMVVSNHDALRSVAEHFGVPYVVTSDPLESVREGVQRSLLDEARADLVVLARYMRVLSPAFVSAWHDRIINIHHSFLPAFVGAQAYRQAKDRGVKMIGATAHYVTNELDQGPIIDQDTCRVTHRDALADVVRKGKELERHVLTRAVRLHLERRVLISGGRTIVFD